MFGLKEILYKSLNLFIGEVNKGQDRWRKSVVEAQNTDSL